MADADLHPQVLAIRDRIKRDRVPHLSTLSIEEARAADRAAAAAGTGEAEPVAEVSEIAIPGPAGQIQARIYRPDVAGPGAGLPVLVYFYGGGWSLGTLDTCDG